MTSPYRIEFVASAAKEFRALPTVVKRRVSKQIDALGRNPRPAGARKLQGPTELYRVRVGPYRVIYEIDDEERRVRVTRIRHRREVYR